MKTFNLCSPTLTEAEAVALAVCARRLPPTPVIIQIGAATGISTCAMLEVRPDAFIYSIDIKACLAEIINVQKLFGVEVAERVVRVRGDSQTMIWEGAQADMLFIDGDHRYDGIKADCENWLDKVNPGGLVVFHDYIPRGAPPKNQVYEVVNEFFGGVEPFIEIERVIGFEKNN